LNELFAAKSSQWRSAKHRQQWENSLKHHALALYNRPVASIDTEAVLGAGREHRVPLSCRAMTIIRTLAGTRTSEFVFPGQNRNAPLASTALETVLEGMKVGGVTVHGFRSAFCDWVSEETPFDPRLVETALAHVAGDATERAYRRGDALEKRRAVMEAWASHCEPGEKVIAPLRAVV
jgi:integrase